MTRARRLAGRVALAVVAAYAVVSLVFALVVAADPARAASLDAYLQWLVAVTTLDWGTSGGTPVTALVADALPKTLAYVVPGMAVAAAASVAAGLYAALHPGGVVDRVLTTSAYVAYGVPTFFVGAILVLAFAIGDNFRGDQYTSGFVQKVVWPAAVLAASLVAGQLRHVRAQTREYAATDLVRLVRAKGGGPLAVARHALRNAALPLISLFFVDLLALVVLEIYVLESVFGVQGLGYLSFTAARNQDLPLVLGTTIVFLVAGVLGSLLQDLAYAELDPRAD